APTSGYRLGPPQELVKTTGPPILGATAGKADRLLLVDGYNSGPILLLDPDRPDTNQQVLPNWPPTSLAVSPDGRWLAAGSNAQGVAVCASNGGQLRVLPDSSAGASSIHVAFSADG